jgi:hypothetical protein
VTSGEAGRVGLKHRDRRQGQPLRGAHGEAAQDGRCRQVDDVRFVRRKHLDQLAGCRDAQAVRPVAQQRDAPQPGGGEANDTMATLSGADEVALGSVGMGQTR